MSRGQARGTHGGQTWTHTELASDGPAISRSIAEVVAVARQVVAGGGQSRMEDTSSASPRRGRAVSRRGRADRQELGGRRVRGRERAHRRGVQGRDVGRGGVQTEVCEARSRRLAATQRTPLPHLACSFSPTWNDVTRPVVKLLAISPTCAPLHSTASSSCWMRLLRGATGWWPKQTSPDVGTRLKCGGVVHNDAVSSHQNPEITVDVILG